MRKAFAGNLTSQIVSKLGQAIVLGEFPTEGPLPSEAQLCASYGTSRTVLREAVKMLTAKGLLNSRPRRGTVVEPESNWNLTDPDVLDWLLQRQHSMPLIEEFIEMRLTLEPAAAGLAAIRATQDEKHKIAAAFDRLEASEHGDDDPIESDIEFHMMILEASHNRFFINMQHVVEVALRFNIRLTNKFVGVELPGIKEHREVKDAILAGDAATAEASMRVITMGARKIFYTNATAS